MLSGIFGMTTLGCYPSIANQVGYLVYYDTLKTTFWEITCTYVKSLAPSRRYISVHSYLVILLHRLPSFCLFLFIIKINQQSWNKINLYPIVYVGQRVNRLYRLKLHLVGKSGFIQLGTINQKIMVLHLIYQSHLYRYVLQLQLLLLLPIYLLLKWNLYNYLRTLKVNLVK